jgi:hypothetical protein
MREKMREKKREYFPPLTGSWKAEWRERETPPSSIASPEGEKRNQTIKRDR